MGQVKHVGCQTATKLERLTDNDIGLPGVCKGQQVSRHPLGCLSCEDVVENPGATISAEG
ncbi:hypothetical protein BH24CHL1_BH24CHL1_09020 [soil metagenome]